MTKTLTERLQTVKNGSGPERLAVLREYVDCSWSDARRHHHAGASGTDVVLELAGAVDDLVQSLYEEAVDKHGAVDGQYAVVALGGYGRNALNPRSDIDLLFLFSSLQSGDLVTRSILHTLWDLRFEVGYSTRSVADCVTAAGEDVESLTSLLECRYLTGDRSLFNRLTHAMEDSFTGSKARSFVQAKVDERNRRHERSGSSVQLQEPNLKESPGGLRDTHTVGWLLAARRNARAPEGLVDERLLSRRSYGPYIESVDFLLRARNELHFMTGKKHDVLDHELQPQVASALGYQDSNQVLGVETFMRDYYLHARNIKHLSDLVCERLRGATSMPSRAFNLIVRRELDDGAILSHTTIQLPRRRKAFFEDDPCRLLSLFLDAQRFGARISEAAQQGIKDNIGLIDDALRASPRAARIFLNILRGPAGVARTLRLMHELGVLGAYLPEFGKITCLVRYNLYHIYTADEHTLVAVDNLERLALRSELAPDLRPLRRVLREVSRREILYLALLLHDVGKAARGEDHSEVGARWARTMLERLGVGADHIASVEFIVRHHLNMSHISQRRDLNDDNMIAEFASRFTNPDDLRMLYLLTYADLSSVTRTAWTAWKGQLLWELYIKTHSLLTGKSEEAETEGQEHVALDALTEALAGRYERRRVTDHLERMPDRYSEMTGPEEVAAHLDLIESLGDSPVSIAITRSGMFSELVVCSHDHPSRLSQICGVLTTNDLNIFSAQAYTRSDGILLDLFQVTGPDGSPDVEQEREDQIQRQLTEVMEERIAVRDLFAQHRARWSRRRRAVAYVPADVVFADNVSDTFSVIDVFAQDEAGLLYQITQTLSDLELDISTARIGTQADRAVDSFYVQRRGGRKVESAEEQAQIRTQLLSQIDDQ